MGHGIPIVCFCSSKRVESWWKLDSHYQLRDFRGFYRPNQQTLRSFPCGFHEEHMENSDMMKYDEMPFALCKVGPYNRYKWSEIPPISRVFNHSYPFIFGHV